MRGRLQFAGAQVFGRKCKRLLRCLSDHVASGRSILAEVTLECLRELSDMLSNNVPRKISSSLSEVVHVYVDASFSKGQYGLGGLMFDVRGRKVSYFRERVYRQGYFSREQEDDHPGA